jgi:diaminobutyrate-2-oxoglutarate transaminase
MTDMRQEDFLNPQKLAIFETHESAARSYCRGFPVIFSKAKGSHLYDEDGQAYIDFLCGAGALNYGHNNEVAKRAVLEYLAADSILMSLDLHSTAKQHFIETFRRLVLEPRGLDYKLQFTSPTGTSVVESSVKLARKVTGRQNVIAFTNAYHGMTGVSLNLTGSRYHRQAVGHGAVTRLPYDGYLGEGCDTAALLRKLLEDASSGVDMPAAVILETIQGEGGLNVASIPWLRSLRELTREFEIPLIVDDIQAGCGRSGRFFSFERAGIVPDMVCLSKSISGMGFPMALLLIRPDLDQWSPGEDNGTFRGNNIAFVAATEVLKRYWNGAGMEEELRVKEALIRQAIGTMARRHPSRIRATPGLGLMQGIEFHAGADAAAVKTLCFESKLLIETCGPRDQVLKIMPALTIERDMLEHGLAIIAAAVERHLGDAAAPDQRPALPASAAAECRAIRPLKVLDALTEEDFIENHVRANEPVVVRDLGFDRDCWTAEHFRRQLGDLPVQVYDTLFDLQEVSTLAAYLDQHFGVPGDYRAKVPYVRWYNKLKNVEHAWGDEAFRRLSPHWRMPSFLPRRGMLMPARPVADAVHDAFPYRGVLVAARGARTRLHRDPFASDAVVYQLSGVKEVVLYRPERADELRARRADGSSFGGFVDVRPTPATLTVQPDYHGFVRPGEVIYIPHGWLHDVLVVEDSLSVTWNFVHEAGALEFIDYLMDSASGSDSEFDVLRYFFKQAGHDFASPRDVVRAYDARFAELQDLAHEHDHRMSTV